MELNTKNIVIGSTLLLVFVLVLFNLDLFSGNASRELTGSKELDIVTTVSVVPEVISPGEYLNVHITPGSKCTDKTIRVYKEGRNYAIASFERSQLGRFGGYRFCKPTIASYKTSTSWEPGKYYVLLKDIGTNSYVRAGFIVE